MLNPVFEMRLGSMANVEANRIGLLYGFCDGWMVAGGGQWGGGGTFGWH